MLLGITFDLAIATGLMFLAELVLGHRSGVPVASRLIALAGVYLVLVAMFWPLSSPIVEPVVEPVAGYPAEAAGIQRGDRVVAVNGTPIDAMEQLGEVARAGKGTPRLSVQRGATVTEVDVPFHTDGRLGLKATGQTRPLSIADRFARPVVSMVFTAKALWELVTGAPKYETVGGPIVLTGGEAIRRGPWTMVVSAAVAAASGFPFVLLVALASLPFKPRVLPRRVAS